MKRILVEFIKLSSIGNQFVVAGSNSIFLLSTKLKQPLVDSNFRYVKIKNTSIEGGQFQGSDFQFSSFSKVFIDGCNFDYCDLRNMNWQGIKTNELPSLINERNCRITKLKY